MIVEQESLARLTFRLHWLQELDTIRTRVFEEVKVNPSVQRQLIGNVIDSPVCAKALELLRGTEFSDIPSDLAIAVKTLFAMPGTVACELSNKATRKQQDKVQEHCKVTGERIPPICFLK